MTQRFVRLALALALLAVGPFAYGQGGSTTAPLSGTVVDSSGAAIPGASVTVRNDATGATYQAVTGDKGTFTVPALQAGTYTVKISLSGFKQAVLKEVKLLAATPGSVRATLEVGGVEETVVVQAESPLVQTQSTAIQQTIQVNEINNLPVASRNALEFLTTVPGVLTAGGTRQSIVSGLDQSAINITIDGMSVQDNYLKTSDGYFARLSPRLDQVEEVTMTTAAAGAETSGQGAIQIRFVSRQGTNQYHGSIYEYLRRDKYNANNWFTNRDVPPDPATGKAPQARLKFDNFGVRVGGPIRIPGIFDGRDKAFFFVNYEESRSPQDVTRQRTILSPAAAQGLFQYNGPGGVQTVNLLQLAAANGQVSTIDPIIAKLLADIRSASQQGGIADLTDPLVQRVTFQNAFSNITRYPSARLDFQLSQKHRLTATYTMNKLLSDPDTLNSRDPAFPGFPIHGVQDSKRFAYQGSLRSTLTSNLVNDLRFFGATGGATLFAPEINPSLYKGTSVADQGGFHLNMNAACCGTGQALTNAHNANPTYQAREASTKVAHDTVSWVRGSHSLNFGLEFTQAEVWLQNQTHVPTINFGLVGGDPAEGLFTTANFPGASTTVLNNARALYAILTGRVLSMTGNARLTESGDYKYLGASKARGRMREFDLFAHDSWRARPNLTLNYGLRYVLQLPLYPLNDSYSTATVEDVWGGSGVGNLFKPGGMTGQKPQFIQYRKGEAAYDTDWNNFAPSLGVTWRPSLNQGLLHALLGSDPVFRAGFAMAYSRNGMSDFTDVFGENPGIQIDATRSQALGNLGTAPVLLREPERLGAPSFQSRPAYPMSDVITQDVTIFDPNIKIPYSMSWSAGIQRELGKNMAFEARYIGTRGAQLWTDFNYNEADIIENGFLNEFRLAQANLQANIAAGRGSNFRYFGPGTGTFPLPIYLAYFNGIPGGQAGDPSLYTSPLFGSSFFIDPLARFNPLPFTPAGTAANSGLDGDAARRANAQRAGLPANFFRANPDLMRGAFIRGNGGGTSYHALELELRRNFSRGLFFRTSYTFGKSYELQRFTLREPWQKRENAWREGGVTHGFKGYAIWELPFGKERRFFGRSSGILDRIIGGWQLAGTTRIQSGRLLDFGNVRLVGMSRKDLKKMFKLRFDDAGRAIYTLPQDVIDNTNRAFNVSATSPTGYGSLGAPSGRYLAPANGPDCIEPTDPNLLPQGNGTQPQFGSNYGVGRCGEGSLIVTGPMFWTADFSLVKRIKLKGNTSIDLRAELLNAFNHTNFVPVTGGGNTADFEGRAATGYQSVSSFLVTTAVEDPRVAQIVARISW
jgi:hypothetical protein